MTKLSTYRYSVRRPSPVRFDLRVDARGHRHGYVRRVDRLTSKHIAYAWLCSCKAKGSRWWPTLEGMRGDFQDHVNLELAQLSLDLDDGSIYGPAHAVRQPRR